MKALPSVLAAFALLGASAALHAQAQAPAAAGSATATAMERAAAASAATADAPAVGAVPAAPVPAALPSAAPGAIPGSVRGGEPDVRHTVIEDEGSRIDELRVRGETQRISVQPKHGGAPYEIVPANGGRDLATGPTTPRGSVGQRVWRVLRF